MKDGKDRELRVQRMQANLGTLRKLAGWTAEQLAEKLGVTKQTICNLENINNHTTMRVAQSIALETIFNAECKNNPQNELLCKAMEELINNPNEDEEQYRKKKMYLDMLASAKYTGKKDRELLDFMTMLATSVGAVASGICVTGISGTTKDIASTIEKSSALTKTGAVIGIGKLFDKFFEGQENKQDR